MNKICYWDSETNSQKERDATPEENAEIEARKIVVIHVPQTITRRQAIQQLIDDDLIDSVEAVLNAIPNPKQKRLMESWYKDSQVFERQRPEIVMVMSALGKDSAFIDDLFIKAAKR